MIATIALLIGFITGLKLSESKPVRKRLPEIRTALEEYSKQMEAK
jgi:hypothetical protein